MAVPPSRDDLLDIHASPVYYLVYREADLPMIVVKRDSEEPVYEQIARQIRDLVISRIMVSGTALPTVRTLASDLGVNLNTVARAYRLLEEEGFIQIRDRSGAEVVSPSLKPPAERDRLQRELRKVLALMRQAGISTEELHRLTEREIESLAGELDS